MTDGGKMSCGRHTAWRGLQARDSTEVRRNANRPTAVASDSSGRAVRRDGRGFAAARSAGGARQVPGIVCAPRGVVVGFVVVQKLGTVSFAQDNGPGRAQPGHGCCILAGAVVQPELTSAKRRK